MASVSDARDAPPAPVPQPPESSPVKASKSVGLQDRKDVANKLLPELEYISDNEFFNILDKKKDLTTPILPPRTIGTQADILDYLNSLSQAVGDDDKETDRILFFNLEDKEPTDHPTGTKCRPDILAIRTGSVKATQPAKPNPPAWSELEVTGEIHSMGTTLEDARLQTAAYACYHLLARPDLVSVVGIYFHRQRSYFRLFFLDAWKNYCTRKLPLIDDATGPLLVAWIRQIYKPERSPYIRRDSGSPTKPTFIIDAGCDTFTGCTLWKVASLSRRSAVFNSKGESGSVVIKSQYFNEKRRFEESDILNTIHGGNFDFPGVVRIQQVQIDPDRCAGIHSPGARLRHRGNDKIRESVLIMKDIGKLIMDARKPLDALIAIYDLFEVTRFLFKSRNILHRDISEGNVLLGEKGHELVEVPEELRTMCFATHLLGKSEVGRLYTRLILIDFHQAEKRGDETRRLPTARSGTPVFQARLIRDSMIRSGRTYNTRPLPQLTEAALECYKTKVPERISEFPKNEGGSRETEDTIIKPYSHMLSYDAESILWLLLWWAIQVQPEKGDHKNQIPGHRWTALTGGEGDDDPRDVFVAKYRAVCHPDYQGLDKLLLSLFDQLSGYQEYVALPGEEKPDDTREKPDDTREKPDDTRMKPDYLHEAFQRILLNFILAHYEDPFMNLEISRIRRKTEKNAEMSQSAKTALTGTKRTSTTVEEEDRSEDVLEREGTAETIAAEHPKRKRSKPNTKPAKGKGLVAREGPDTRSKSTSNTQSAD